jgi:hypothetical protein
MVSQNAIPSTVVRLQGTSSTSDIAIATENLKAMISISPLRLLNYQFPISNLQFPIPARPG